MNETRKIFEYQIWHLISLIAMIFAINSYVTRSSEMLSGIFWGINTTTWFWLAIAIPIIHQVYVWLIWRFELYQRTFTKRYGLKRSFNVYAVGFSILFVSRLIAIIILAYSDKNTLHINPVLTYVLAALITPLVIYLFYSVKKYCNYSACYLVYKKLRHKIRQLLIKYKFQRLGCSHPLLTAR